MRVVVRRRGPDPILAVVLFAATAYLIACTFFFPAVPILLGGDQTFFWTYADRMLRGERIYRDFFQFTPPGTDLVFLGAFALFGRLLWVANAVVVALGVSLAWLCFHLARSLADRVLASLVTAVFIVFVYGKSLNATHHWFSMLPIMGAVCVLQPGSTHPRFAAAGAMLGLAAFFTQSHGAIALIAFTLYTGWQAHAQRLSYHVLQRQYVALFGAFAFVLVAASGYFIATIGFERIWSSQVAFVWHHMPRDSWRDFGLGETLTLKRVPALSAYFVVYAALPIVYALGLRHFWQNRPNHRSNSWATLTLLCLLGTMLLIEVASHLSWLRVFSVAMPAFILLAWLLSKVDHWRRWLIGIIWLGVACVGLHRVSSMRRHNPLLVHLPAGDCFTDAIHREKLEWLARKAHAGDFFFSADWPLVYLSLGLRSAVFPDVVVDTEQTRPEQIARAIGELEARQVQFALWPSRLNDVKTVDESSGSIAALRDYVHGHYHLVQVFSDDVQVWERR